MDPIPVPEAARLTRPDCRFVRMGPPQGVSDEDCGTAEMLVASPPRIRGYSGGGNYAYYRPNQDELEQLRNGGFLELGQYGNVVQPFSLTVWPPPPTEGGIDDDATGQGTGGGEPAAVTRTGADDRDVGAVVSEVPPAHGEGGVGEPAADASSLCTPPLCNRPAGHSGMHIGGDT